MNEQVHELVAGVRLLSVFDRLYIKLNPQFERSQLWINIDNMINGGISTDEQLQELISLLEDAVVANDQFNADHDVPELDEVTNAWDRVNILIAELKTS